MSKSREELVSELSQLIITSVNLVHKKKEDITAETPLMGEGLSLDSLDILEIVVSVEKAYQIKIQGPEQGKKIFRTVGTLADFVQEQTQLSAS